MNLMWQLHEIILLEFQGCVARDFRGLANPSSELPGTIGSWALSEEESPKSCGLEMLLWTWVSWGLHWGKILSVTPGFDFLVITQSEGFWLAFFF